jgi:hypothetical protein
VQRGTQGGEEVDAAKLVDLEARLNDLEKQLRELPQ